MSFQFKKAERKGVHTILGLMGGTGSGKTWSALELATGLAQGKPFAFIDTEAGRALHYADHFDFQHGDLSPPFTPLSYQEAILAAEKAGFPVVVVDSFSHEHAGDGGILDMHDAEIQRLTEGDWQKVNRFKMLAWVKPKAQHKRMVSKLLQLRVHLILCFRAEPKVKMVTVERETKIIDIGWQPISAKGLDFEMSASFMLRNEHPGQVTTGQVDQMDPTGSVVKLPEPLKEIFTGTHLLSRKHGEAVAKWAEGGSETTKKKPKPNGSSEILKKIGAEFKGRLSRDEIWLALEAANLKDEGADLPPSTPWHKVKSALDKALEIKARENARDPEPEEAEAESGAKDILGNNALTAGIVDYLGEEHNLKATGPAAIELTRVLKAAGLITAHEKWHEVDDKPWESVERALKDGTFKP